MYVSSSLMSICGSSTCDSQKYLQKAHLKLKSSEYHLFSFFKRVCVLCGKYL